MVEQDEIIQAVQSENKDRAFQQNKKKKRDEIIELAKKLTPEDLGDVLVKLNYMHLDKMFPKDKNGKRSMRK